MTYAERYAEYKEMVETYLAQRWPGKRGMSYDGLLESMSYSLLAGGKRLRPILLLEFCRICGGDVKKALPVACAVEMLHTYSLIHDDLPCMDDDDLRRGKPTNHVVYGECTAVLAGDAMQAEAFGAILRSGLSSERKVACAEILAGAAGVDGICGGQYLDMDGGNQNLNQDELTELQSRKTGSLFSASCMMGVAAAGGTERMIETAGLFGATLGSAFQIRDDMLDKLSTDEELGKPIGSDEAEGKSTFMSLWGEERCRDMVEKLTDGAAYYVGEFEDSEFLTELVRSLVERRS